MFLAYLNNQFKPHREMCCFHKVPFAKSFGTNTVFSLNHEIVQIVVMLCWKKWEGNAK